MITGNLPRIQLAHLPTPLEEMTRLRGHLGKSCPRLLIKRDDQTGLATGGNKARKLEFLVAQAVAEGATTLITAGAPQSNHCRQTAAAAAKLGLRCILVLGGEEIPRSQWNGNLLLDHLLGAEIHWAERSRRAETMASLAQELRDAGTKPFVIPVGGSVPVGSVGYVAAVEEVAEQLAVQDIQLNRMIVVTGSGGTHAGVLVGARALGWDCIVEGMSNSPDEDLISVVRQLTPETAQLLGLDLRFTDDDFILFDALGKHGYGTITDAEREAIRLLAQTEGIILDPVYTARAFGEMVHRIKTNQYSPDETILFWHTGGAGGLFPRAVDIMA